MFPVSCGFDWRGREGLHVTLELLCLLPLLSAPVPKGKLILYPKHIPHSPSVHRHDTSVSAIMHGLTCFWDTSHVTLTWRMWLLLCSAWLALFFSFAEGYRRLFLSPHSPHITSIKTCSLCQRTDNRESSKMWDFLIFHSVMMIKNSNKQNPVQTSVFVKAVWCRAQCSGGGFPDETWLLAVLSPTKQHQQWPITGSCTEPWRSKPQGLSL